MVKRLVFAFPGDLKTPTGGFVYDRRIIRGLVALGWQVETMDLGDGFPHPSAQTRESAAARLAALPNDAPIVADGLALGAMPEVATRLRDSHDLVALVHHPLALESGLSPGDAAALRGSEVEALAGARRVIVTSAFTARLIGSDYGVPADKVMVVRPGVDPSPQAHFAAEGPLRLLAVGAVTARKGYDVLLAAMAALRDLPWRLDIAGDLGRDGAAVERLFADIADFDLTGRVSVLGAISAASLEDLYARSDIFVLASRFEGYGMAYAEAIAHGLPVIGTDAGAIPETVGDAGLLTPADDSLAFAATIRRLIEDGAERRRLARAAWAAAAALPTWEQAAELFSRAVETAA